MRYHIAQLLTVLDDDDDDHMLGGANTDLSFEY